MITEHDLVRIKRWFEDHVRSLKNGESGFDRAIELKVHHSRTVAMEALAVCNTLGCASGECYRIEIAALLHDIGRFEQYRRYRTYSDHKSVDHAALGVEVIRQTGVLETLETDERMIIATTVKLHNRAVSDVHADVRLNQALRVVRDADKIDILRIVTDHYAGVNTHDVVEAGLADSSAMSDRIVNAVQQGLVADIRDVRTLNDFKLLQIGWLFDLNYAYTHQVVLDRGYLDRLAAALPHSDSVGRIVAAARSHLQKNSARERNLSACMTP